MRPNTRNKWERTKSHRILKSASVYVNVEFVNKDNDMIKSDSRKILKWDEWFI